MELKFEEMKNEVRKKEIEVDGRVKEMEVKTSHEMNQLARPSSREGTFSAGELINLLNAFSRAGVGAGAFSSPGPRGGGNNAGNSPHFTPYNE